MGDPAIEACVGSAHAYVRREGDELDLVFFETLLQERPAAELLGALAERQDGRGAIGGGLVSTLRALRRLEALGLADHPVPERACVWLCSLQDGEGAWAPGGAADDEERIAWTGCVGGLLAGTPFARSSVLRGAEAFLASRWSVERVKGPSYEPILAYTHLLSQVPSELADEALHRCGLELDAGFRMGAFSPLATARVFLRARVRALPGSRIAGSELVASLLAAQQPDGSWPPTDPDQDPVDATLEAVEALLRLS